MVTVEGMDTFFLKDCTITGLLSAPAMNVPTVIPVSYFLVLFFKGSPFAVPKGNVNLLYILNKVLILGMRYKVCIVDLETLVVTGGRQVQFNLRLLISLHALENCNKFIHSTAEIISQLPNQSIDNELATVLKID